VTNAAHLATVNKRLRAAIFAFRAKVVMAPFHAEDLSTFVTDQVGKCAPGSADRVLRDLRQTGHLNYEVLDRANSRYRFLPRKTT